MTIQPTRIQELEHATLDSRWEGEPVELTAADGYKLAATRFEPPGQIKGNVVVAGAIGVPQGFYRAFARFAALHGHLTLTFDYRGVGRSAPDNLRDFHMDASDWGRLDLAAAVNAMSTVGRPTWLVAHSFGGHAFAFLPHPEKITGVYAFGTGAGWHGWMPRLERVKVLAMWHALGPALTFWKGYLAWSRLGMGQDIPLDFYRQWKHWCHYPNFFLGDPSMRSQVERMSRIRTPMLAANSVDDRWSPPQSRDAFIAGFCNARLQTLNIDPGHMKVSNIGHMGYFRASAVPLWTSALDWLESLQLRESAG
jgi:predicted alpha/beta hydrolase